MVRPSRPGSPSNQKASKEPRQEIHRGRLAGCGIGRMDVIRGAQNLLDLGLEREDDPVPVGDLSLEDEERVARNLGPVGAGRQKEGRNAARGLQHWVPASR